MGLGLGLGSGLGLGLGLGVEEADGLHGDGEVGRGLLHPLHELQLLDEVPDPPGAGSA